MGDIDENERVNSPIFVERSKTMDVPRKTTRTPEELEIINDCDFAELPSVHPETNE
jgi:hypothetical protein